MRSRKLLLPLAIAGATVAVPLASAADFDVQLNVAPPPPRTEVIPASPGENYVWAPGYWDWRDGNYVWSNGHYIERHGDERWVPDRWAEHDGRWQREHGHWDREKARHEEHE